MNFHLKLQSGYIIYKDKYNRFIYYYYHFHNNDIFINYNILIDIHTVIVNETSNLDGFQQISKDIHYIKQKYIDV